MSNDFKAGLHQILEDLSPHIGMLFVLPSACHGPQDILMNGTASFVHTGARRLLVTCDHVYQAFLDERARNPEAALCLAGGSENGAPVLDITRRHNVVSRGSSDIDLTTLTLTAPDEISTIHASYFAAQEWPPPRLKAEEPVCFAGFPGLHREASERGLEMRVAAVSDFATTVSDRHFLIVDENLERNTAMFQPNLPPFGSLGGVSGAAVYWRGRDSRELVLAGFVYESNEGAHATFFVHHADFLSVDGAISG